MANVDSYFQAIKSFDSSLAAILLDDEVLYVIDRLSGFDQTSFEWNMEMYASTGKAEYRRAIISIIQKAATAQGNRHVLNII